MPETIRMGVHMRGYRLRCYPNSAQRALLPRMFGAARWVWNQCLRARSQAYADPELTAMFGRGLSVSAIDFGRVMTRLKREPETAWLDEIDAGMLQQALRDQDKAFANFFAGRTKYPRYKRRGQHQGIRFSIDHRHAGKVKAWNDGRLVLPQLGEMQVVWSRRPATMPKVVTLCIDAAGRYYLSLAVQEEIESLPTAGASLGVDVGVTHLAVLSDGTRISNGKKLQRRLRHLKRLARAMSRKAKGSGRRRRAQHRLARLHAKIADARRDALHQSTSSIIRRAQLIAIEDLNVNGMMANRHLSRALADASISELHRQLAYKAKWHGRALVQLDPWEPTSQVCSACGYQHRKLQLKDRVWACPACGTQHDRDVNAARNILAGGLRLIAGTGVGRGAPDLMRVEGGRPSRPRRQPVDRGHPAKREPGKSGIRAARGGAART